MCAGAGESRCLVLRFRKANILLDCAVPLDSALYAAAVLGEREAGTDAVDTPGASAPDTPGPHPQPSVAAGALLDLTPFLPLLHTLDLHAALISSAEALLALPHLLTQPFEHQVAEQLQAHPPAGKSAHDAAPSRAGPAAGGYAPSTGRTDASGSLGRDMAGAAEWVPCSGTAWHHVGPIRGPIYATQAAIDAAEQLVAERWAAQRGTEAASSAGPMTGAAAKTGSAPSLKSVAGHTKGALGLDSEAGEREGAGSGGSQPSAASLGLWDLPDRQARLLAGSCWRRRPALDAVRYVLDRVRPVRYGQVVPLDDYELTAAPYPSGSGFGHAAWQITDGAERCRTVLYLPNAAPTHAFAPPLPLPLLRQPDALLLGPNMLAALAPPPPGPATAQASPHALPPPQPPPARPGLAGIKEAVLGAVMSGGVAVLPVHPNGDTAWELLEALAASLASADLADSVPLAYVGPRARTSLALASVSLEALGPERQAAVYRPAHPFAFDTLLRSGRLVVGSSLADEEVQQRLWPSTPLPVEAMAAGGRQRPHPAVVLVSADSLLYPGGAAQELLLHLGPDPHSVLILPHTAAPAALCGIRRIYAQASAAAAAAAAAGQQQQPLRMRLLHLPLHGAGASSGPSAAGMLELLQLLQPRHLLLSSRDHELLQQAALLRRQQPQQQQQPTAVVQLARERVVPYGWLSQAVVPLPRNVHGALISPDLLARLQWLGAGPGLQVARLNCVLVFRAGAWHADPVPGSATSSDSVAAAVATAGGGAVAADQLLLLAAAPAPPAAPAASHGMKADGVGTASGGTAAALVKAEVEGGATPAASWTPGPELGPLLAALAERGVTHIAVEVEAEVTRLVVRGMSDGTMELRPGGAHIHTACPVLRQLLTDCLMRQLTAI
ncbi:hypothetical protein HYH02_004067 [Chlamydomonas schloesseri]|uniref:Integrator complex subunit 9 n=1 Tax=Chlamydomonas schloesseri TaxID=2026947 RepID=A0A835WP65_9CHLO|nr:hypothetical protein HYH02_004067 [Chlamydomonas schloesseri]|eukprot:KAG2451469.1 hypothetical protein HYH02_004067 [Chlamydomonas schloesseri]